jgi:hypothetical protein
MFGFVRVEGIFFLADLYVDGYRRKSRTARILNRDLEVENANQRKI